MLNVGTEEVKGIEEIKLAGRILRETPIETLDYHGFVEGNDIGLGTVDVVVTEGFAGNIALKTADYGYVLEVGRIVLEDSCAALMEKDDIKEFYLGQKDSGVRGKRRWKKKKLWR